MEIRTLVIAGIIVGAFPAGAPFADDAQARTIMQKVDARDDGDNGTSEMQMILIDKRGHERQRRIKTFSKDKGKDAQRIMFFLEPADVTGTGFLTYDYDDPDHDDDQWLYLPALKKTKRIASSDRSGSFMGSDFSYADMTARDLQDYDFKLVKEETINGTNTWLIETTPRNAAVIEETGYTKSILFVRQDNFVVVRAVNWVKEGKKLKYFEVKQLEQVDGIWVATEMHMTTKRGDETLHRTVLRQLNVHFNQPLEDNMFTTRQLEKGL